MQVTTEVLYKYIDHELVKSGLDFSKRKRKWIIALGLVGLWGYGIYKVYNLPAVEKKRRRLLRLLGAFLSVAEMVSDSADTIGVVSKDLKVFLQSDSDEIPRSLKQLAKIARSQEFLKCLSRITETVAVGVLRGYSTEKHQNETEEVKRSDITDRIMDRLVSSAGTGFVSAVVGSFARNLVLGFYAVDDDARGGDGDNGQMCIKPNSSSMNEWLQLMCNDKCRVLMADCVQSFVSTAVAVYLDKTMSINFYDELFSGITNPNHEGEVRNLFVSLCNGAVETLVKTSHEVLTASKSDSGSSTIASSKPESTSSVNDMRFDDEVEPLRNMKEANRYTDIQNTGWVSSVSSTLAIPSNRKFVLDVTGRVTFESIRSLVEFCYWKISEGLQRSFCAVREDAIERGLEVIRYIGAKSHVILALSLALILHSLDRTHALLPA